jgi:hypothetical protein
VENGRALFFARCMHKWAACWLKRHHGNMMLLSLKNGCRQFSLAAYFISAGNESIGV